MAWQTRSSRSRAPAIELYETSSNPPRLVDGIRDDELYPCSAHIASAAPYRIPFVFKELWGLVCEFIRYTESGHSNCPDPDVPAIKKPRNPAVPDPGLCMSF